MVDIGDKINGRYDIVRNIGSGGMANVFLAHDLILNRDVAVKVLRFDFLDDQSAIRRFRREALAASELVHPNIVGVYDVGEENGRQYLVMEYVKGTDLKKYIRDYFPVPLENVIIIMRQILSAISLAHEHRIIHRDLKPQNILMDEEGNVKIADFGIAIALSETSLTQTNTLLGSVHYLSPEQARGSMATRQSDIYALGIILYELLAGKVPFEGESAVSIALKHFQSEIPSVREINKEIPQALENVILKATTKEPSDRYVSAEEMAQDIATSLSPERANEPKFQPQVLFDETKVLTPITDSQMPESFKNMTEEVEAVSDDKANKNTENQTKPKKKKGSKKKKALFLALAVILAALAAFFFYPVNKEVPDVSGKTVAEATQLLEAEGFKVDSSIEKEASDTVDEGLVIRTSPRASGRVKEGGKITLLVSSGPDVVSLDDYVGVQYEKAVEELVSLGFKRSAISKEEVEDSDYESGQIISQEPAVSSKVSLKDGKITFKVSAGTTKVKLENLTGYSLENAVNYFNSVGLSFTQKYEYSSAYKIDTVIWTSPEAGTELAKGNSVVMVLSKGPEPVVSAPQESSSSAEESQSQTSSSATESESSSQSEPVKTEETEKKVDAAE